MPAWPILRIRRWYVAIPVSALLSCWLLFTWAGFTVELNPDYDGFGAGMTILFSPGLAIGYAVVLFVLHMAIRQGRPARFTCGHPRAGLAVWMGLCAFCVVVPFIAPPRARRGDPLFLVDYFFFCGPILLLALTMSLVYLWRLVFAARGPTHSNDESLAAAPQDMP